MHSVWLLFTRLRLRLQSMDPAMFLALAMMVAAMGMTVMRSTSFGRRTRYCCHGSNIWGGGGRFIAMNEVQKWTRNARIDTGQTLGLTASHAGEEEEVFHWACLLVFSDLAI